MNRNITNETIRGSLWSPNNVAFCVVLDSSLNFDLAFTQYGHLYETKLVTTYIASSLFFSIHDIFRTDKNRPIKKIFLQYGH